MQQPQISSSLKCAFKNTKLIDSLRTVHCLWIQKIAPRGVGSRAVLSKNRCNKFKSDSYYCFGIIFSSYTTYIYTYQRMGVMVYRKNTKIFNLYNIYNWSGRSFGIIWLKSLCILLCFFDYYTLISKLCFFGYSGFSGMYFRFVFLTNVVFYYTLTDWLRIWEIVKYARYTKPP